MQSSSFGFLIRHATTPNIHATHATTPNIHATTCVTLYGRVLWALQT